MQADPTLIQERKPEKCMYCANVEVLVEVSEVKDFTPQKGVKGVLTNRRKMCYQCFLEKVWNKQ